MKQYIWFHPLYILETSKSTFLGQMRNAIKNHYTVLDETELHKVSSGDHLTIVGHSTAPKVSLDKNVDNGLYIQGETAPQLVHRLKQSGLKKAPTVLSLESCHTGIEEGIALKLSIHPFLNNTLIEASSSGIGRNPGNVKWGGMTVDIFGRVLLNASKHPWIFLLSGKIIATHQHGKYKLDEIVDTVLSLNFHNRFFKYYRPGFFGGRVGRYCHATGQNLTLELAKKFAEEDPNSATAKALDCLLLEYSPAKLV